MKHYIIKPNSGHPYINIRTDVPHKEMGNASPARRGEVLLAVQHNSGLVTDLSFKANEVEEVKS